MINCMKNIKHDELYTPSEAIFPMLQYIPSNITVWEPTDVGSSMISQLLREHGCNVISTHIDTGFDFLIDKPNFDFDMIITNPPYSKKDEFLSKCYYYGKPFALLLPITALAGKKRVDLYSKHGVDLIVFDKRINYMKDSNKCWFATAWFTWHLINKTKFIKISEETKCRQQQLKFMNSHLKRLKS